MSDTNNSSLIDNKSPVERSAASAPDQFLTVSYNPAAHPKQIFLLDTNGQPIQYMLIPPNQPIPPQMVSQQAQPYHTGAVPNANACSICGAEAVDKCWYGTVQGRPCGRLLCLTHLMELPSVHGGRYPHCPEHYHFIKKNALCNVL